MVEGAAGAASGLQPQDYQGFSGASASQRSARTSQMVDPNSREATLSRKNNLLLSGLVLATITGMLYCRNVCTCAGVYHADLMSHTFFCCLALAATRHGMISITPFQMMTNHANVT